MKKSDTTNTRQTEGFSDRQVSLDLIPRSTRAVLFANDLTTTTVHDTIDATHSVLRALDIDKVDGFAETGLSSIHGSLHGTLGRGHDLTSTTMDSIRVKGDVGDVDAHATDKLFAQHTLTSGQLEGSADVILDFVQVLHSLRYKKKS